MSRLPTFAQTRRLRWIAQHGGVVMLTITPTGKYYTFKDGTPLNRREAEGVIPYMIARKDGLFDPPQSWTVKKPSDR